MTEFVNTNPVVTVILAMFAMWTVAAIANAIFRGKSVAILASRVDELSKRVDSTNKRIDALVGDGK